MRVHSGELYTKGFDNASLTLLSNASAAPSVLFTNTTHQQFVSALTSAESTLTALHNIIDITAAPVFNPTATKFYCYVQDQPLTALIQRALTRLSTLRSSTLASRQMKLVDAHVLATNRVYNVSRNQLTAQTNLLTKKAVVQFVHNEWQQIEDQSNTLSEHIALYWVYCIFGLGILPVLTCCFGNCGFGMIVCGEDALSESLEGWDTHAGMFTHVRQVSHLEGCVSKTGAHINAWSWCCSLLVSSLYFLIGGLLLVGSGVGNDFCTFMPAMVSDLPLYLPSASPSTSNKVSNERLKHSLLPICLKQEESDAQSSSVSTTRTQDLIGAALNIRARDYDLILNITWLAPPWSDFQGNVTQVLLDVKSMQDLGTDCFWSSSKNSYDKVSNSQTFENVRISNGVTDTDSDYRAQKEYMDQLLGRMNNEFDMHAVQTTLEQLQHVVRAMESLDVYLNVLKTGFNITQIRASCQATQESAEEFQKVTCQHALPLIFLMGVFLLVSAVAGLLICCTTLKIQCAWGGHGPVPLSMSSQGNQHRQSIEMKKNPMGEGDENNGVIKKKKSNSVVHDLHGEMQDTSWM